MKLNDIQRYFQDRKDSTYGMENFYSVFVPLVQVDRSLHLLFQVRAQGLRHQPGEVAFPGGKVERGEAFVEAAIRETCEELGLAKQDLSVFGSLDAQLNAFNNMIFPFVGTIQDFQEEKLETNPGEVERIFTVPVDFFADHPPKAYNMRYEGGMDKEFPVHKIKNQEMYANRKWTHPVYFYEYEDHIIWGLTAKITKNLIEELKEIDADRRLEGFR